MTIGDALRSGGELLRHAPPDARIDTPDLDAALLLAEALHITREKLYASLPDPLEETEFLRFRSLVDQRILGHPVSYIRGRKEFYGLTFTVGPQVLVPRPDTETLVEAAIELVPRDARLHDVCTGSGCVAIALASERRDLEVSVSDISEQVEEVFVTNSRRLLGRQLPFVLCDLLSRVRGRFHAITANPPYLTDRQVDRMKQTGWPEPALALAGGADGMDLVIRLIREAPEHLLPDGYLLMEADPGQMAGIRDLLTRQGFQDLQDRSDLAGRQRVVIGRWPGVAS